MAQHVWCACEFDVELHCHCSLPGARAHTMGVLYANGLEWVARAAARVVEARGNYPEEDGALQRLDLAVAALQEVE